MNSVVALDVVLQLAFLICVCFAVITDFRTLLIPNWISLALLAAFAPFAVLHLPLSAIGGHFLVMAIVLALSVFFFVVGWVGGGDVKLMAACALWAGPTHIVEFIMVTTLYGALLSAAFLLPAFRQKAEAADAHYVGTLTAALRRRLPYGLAIATGAVVVCLRLLTEVRA